MWKNGESNNINNNNTDDDNEKKKHEIFWETNQSIYLKRISFAVELITDSQCRLSFIQETLINILKFRMVRFSSMLDLDSTL